MHCHLMTQILAGKPLIATMIDKQKKKIQEFGLWSDHYLAIIRLGDHKSSQVYVHKKKEYGATIGLQVRIYRQSESMKTLEHVLDIIDQLNQDTNCIGMLLQLPLPWIFSGETERLCVRVQPSKDVDGLGWIINGLSGQGILDFLPATPAAVLSLLEWYGHKQWEGKLVVILGQSNLTGKPLAWELIKHGAAVFSCNHHTDQSVIKKICQWAEYVISCTGKVHLIDKSFLRGDGSQIVVDVGYGHKNGKAVGDVDFDDVVDTVQAITPVPWWVGPVTVAQLFENMLYLYENRKKIGYYLGH